MNFIFNHIIFIDDCHKSEQHWQHGDYDIHVIVYQSSPNPNISWISQIYIMERKYTEKLYIHLHWHLIL